LTDPVSLPLWLFVPVVAFAAWAALDRLFVPSVRWFFRRRINRVLGEVGQRLHVKIPEFHLTKRQVLIDRLVFDREVQAAAQKHAAENDMPREVAIAHVQRYAREIVPAFNAHFYFKRGYAMAQRISRLFYHVRLGYADDEGLKRIAGNATPIFVINHRSNMDYVLAAYLAAERSALSYAVGEWARVWPLQSLIKMMGGFFVRRNSKNALYRKVLERYVQMATEGGVPQAMFPEGRLSRDGALGEARLGLLEYVARAFDPKGERDVVFVPVGVNYDRVIEDRNLLASLDPDAPKQKPVAAMFAGLGFVIRQIWLAVRGKWVSFGYAVVNFGTPVSLKAWLAARGLDLRALPPEERIEQVKRLAGDLMASVAKVIPVLPVPLIATVFRRRETLILSEEEVKTAALKLLRRLGKTGAIAYMPHRDQDYAIALGLEMLKVRHIVEEEDGLLRINEAFKPLLDYYANSIAHLTEAAEP
jgi:glycerol-3-phosphate O-acyltransferase